MGYSLYCPFMERLINFSKLHLNTTVSRRGVLFLGGVAGTASLVNNAVNERRLGSYSSETQAEATEINRMEVPLGRPLQIASTSSNKIESFTIADSALPLRVSLLEHPIHLVNSHPSGQSTLEENSPDTIVFYQIPDILQGYFIESRDILKGEELAVSVAFGSRYIYREINPNKFVQTRAQIQNSEYPVKQNGIQIGQSGLWFKVDRSQFAVQSLFDNLGVDSLYTPGEAFYTPFSRDVQSV